MGKMGVENNELSKIDVLIQDLMALHKICLKKNYIVEYDSFEHNSF